MKKPTKGEIQTVINGMYKSIYQKDIYDIYGCHESKGKTTMSQDKKSNYYDTGNIETIEIIKAKLTHEQYIGYLLGNVIKYASRLNFKGHKSRDSEKLSNYSKWLESEINDGVPGFDYRLDDQKVEDGLMTAAGEREI